MIHNLHIKGVHIDVTHEMQLYVEKKIGGLYKYIPRTARESAHVSVMLKQAKSKTKQPFECEVIMKLPGTQITAHRVSSSMLASIDEVSDNLKNQLRHYKNMHSPSRLHRHVISRFKRRAASM